MSKNKVIAVDGPAGSGKGTICSLIAKKTGYFYVDSGVYYRAVMYIALKRNVDISNIDNLVEIANNIDVKFVGDKIFVNGEDVTNDLRTEEINSRMKLVNGFDVYRNAINNQIRKLVNDMDIIIDGRDTTSVLFPDATYKFYVDCDVDVRAKRRYDQSISKGLNVTFEEIKQNIIDRDYADMHREVAPLVRVKDAIYIDTTNDTIEESVNKIMEKINSVNLKDLYINFFVEKGHKQIPSAPVVPENDPSVLFNTAGMQPLVPYLMGQPHPYGTRLTDYQKCVRTNDLDNIGDTYHHTFFEMLGNWSLGDYFKKEAITWSFEFLTKVLNIPVERLAVTVFAGNDTIPFDEEAYNLWLSLGIPKERITPTKDDNFWIAGETGPCGPDSEMFYWRSEDPIPEKFDTEDNRWVEIWNDVFMQYEKHEDGSVTELPKKNVDTGMGVERTTAILEGKTDNYASSIWTPIINEIESISGLTYEGNEKSMRIIADHIRTAVFILADPAGIKPSNTDQGYILRRLIRRAIRHAKRLNIDINSNWEERIATKLLDMYDVYYSELKTNREVVLEGLKNEKVKFNRTLEKGLREFEKVTRNSTEIDGVTAFHLFDTFGFPIELTVELAEEAGLKVDVDGYHAKFKEHQELSRSASAGKFKGGLAGHSEIETRYHTATHLLNAALKKVIGPDVHQRGSNITDERMRFDFNCDHKLTDEEKMEAEKIVNEWINAGLDVTVETMKKEDAVKSGAECMFIEKYPDEVTVYSIGNETYGTVSKELCGGPHVKNTKELGKFVIKKEEASSAGVRRIKAVLEGE